jgi:4-hydroxybenzoate polyprenyltransferase
MAYDTIYAKADFTDDINLSIHSSPKLFKKYTNRAIVAFYLAFLTLYAILIKEEPYFIAYFLIVTFMIGKMVHELIFDITQDGDYINLFKKNNYLGIIVTFIFLLSHTWIF